MPEVRCAPEMVSDQMSKSSIWSLWFLCIPSSAPLTKA